MDVYKIFRYAIFVILIVLAILTIIDYFVDETENKDPIVSVGERLLEVQPIGNGETRGSTFEKYQYKGVEFAYPAGYRVEVIDKVGLIFKMFSPENSKLFATEIVVAPRNEDNLTTEQWIRGHYKSGLFEFAPVLTSRGEYFYDPEMGLAITTVNDSVISVFNGKNERRLDENTFIAILDSISIDK